MDGLPEDDKGRGRVDKTDNNGNGGITKEVVGQIQLTQVCEIG